MRRLSERVEEEQLHHDVTRVFGLEGTGPLSSCGADRIPHLDRSEKSVSVGWGRCLGGLTRPVS